MTGFFIKTRGSSLANAAPIAGMRILGSVKADTGIRLREVEVAMGVGPDAEGQNSVWACIARCSTTGPSASAGK